MKNIATLSEQPLEATGATSMDMKIEVIVIPVANVDRAKRFYAALGWRLDLDFNAGDEYRVIQFTPPGSACSIIFGKNVSTAVPGSSQGLHLIVSDIADARSMLIRQGIDVGGPFHDAGGVFHHADKKDQVDGVNTQRQSYASYASFKDPDGNGWLLQEVTARLSADIKSGDARFTHQIVDWISRGATK